MEIQKGEKKLLKTQLVSYPFERVYCNLRLVSLAFLALISFSLLMPETMK